VKGGIQGTPDFEVVRLKNKIGELKKPFNMHVSMLFKPVKCEDPILCEEQFCLREVLDLMQCAHLSLDAAHTSGGHGWPASQRRHRRGTRTKTLAGRAASAAVRHQPSTAYCPVDIV